MLGPESSGTGGAKETSSANRCHSLRAGFVLDSCPVSTVPPSRSDGDQSSRPSCKWVVFACIVPSASNRTRMWHGMMFPAVHGQRKAGGSSTTQVSRAASHRQPLQRAVSQLVLGGRTQPRRDPKHPMQVRNVDISFLVPSSFPAPTCLFPPPRFQFNLEKTHQGPGDPCLTIFSS